MEGGSYVVSSNICIDDGVFIRCPFNSTHRVLAPRFPYHFVKCKASYPNVEIVHCPFNAKHCLRKEELQDHIPVCPHRTKIDPVIVEGLAFSAVRPKPAQSMIDRSFMPTETAPPRPPEEEVIVPTKEEIEEEVEKPTEPQTEYVSFLHQVVSGDLLRQSLAELEQSVSKSQTSTEN